MTTTSSSKITNETDISTSMPSPRFGFESTITSVDEHTFLSNLKDSKFRLFLNDYMTNRSDLDHQNETNRHVLQMKNNHNLSTNKRQVSIRPKTGFVVKTKWNQTQKVFINVCSSTTIQAPCNLKANVNVNSRLWHLPCSLGLERLEIDTRGANVPTFDVCFHPQVVELAMARVDYRDIVIQTCFDAVEKTMRDSRCASTALLARKYHILKGVCYKSGDPIPMRLRNDQEEIELPQSKKMQEAQVTKKIERDVCQDKSTMLDDRGPITAVSGQNDDSVLNTLAHVDQTNDSTSFIKEVSCIDLNLQQQLVKLQPKKKLEYQLIHRGRYEHLPADPNNRVPDSVFCPEKLVIKMSIPFSTSAKGIDVDVSEQMLRLSVDLDVAGNYEPLELALPFPVIEDKSCARFDRKKHHLVITLPVQPPKSKPQSYSLVVQDDDEEAENKELPQNIVGTPECSKMVATEQRRKGEEGLLMLQKTTSMVAKDPHVVVNNPLKAQRHSPTAVTSSPRSAVTELAAMKDDISDNLPPLTSCGDEETDTSETRAEEMKSPSSMLAPVKLASKALKPIKPYFETHDTLECLSYIVGVAGIDSTSVKLTFPSDSSLRLQFADSEKKVYEMFIAAFPADIDPSTAEFDVASENMVVILRKSNTQLSIIEA